MLYLHKEIFLVDVDDCTYSLVEAEKPGKLFKSRLFRMTGEEILEPYLGTVSFEDKFQMINRLYDQYDNLITNLDFDLNTLQIKMAPVNTTKSHTSGVDLSSQTNGVLYLL